MALAWAAQISSGSGASGMASGGSEGRSSKLPRHAPVTSEQRATSAASTPDGTEALMGPHHNKGGAPVRPLALSWAGTGLARAASGRVTGGRVRYGAAACGNKEDEKKVRPGDVGREQRRGPDGPRQRRGRGG